MSQTDFLVQNDLTHKLVTREDDRFMKDHAFEKTASFIVRKNGSYYEAIQGGGTTGAGTIAYGGSGNAGGIAGTDCAAVINAALTGMGTIYYQSKVAVKGDCTINKSIKLPSYCCLDLTEATVTLDNNSDSNMFELTAPNQQWIKVIGGNLDGNKANQASGNIFDLNGVTLLSISGTYILNAKQDGLKIYGGSSHTYVNKLYGVRINGSGVNGLEYVGAELDLTDCSISTSGDCGVNFSSSAYGTFKGGTYEGNVNYDFYLVSSHTVKISDVNRTSTIGGVDNGTFSYIYNSYDVHVHDNTVVDATIGVHFNHANSVNNLILGNRFNHCGTGVYEQIGNVNIINSNHFQACTTPIIKYGASTKIGHDNIGFTLYNCGSQSVSDGGTIAHGLIGLDGAAVAPTSYGVIANAFDCLSNVTAYDTANLTISNWNVVSGVPYATARVIKWWAEYKP